MEIILYLEGTTLHMYLSNQSEYLQVYFPMNLMGALFSVIHDNQNLVVYILFTKPAYMKIISVLIIVPT